MLWVKQSHDAVVPGETGSHHEDAHSTDEGGNVTHVGEAIPKDRNTQYAHKFWVSDDQSSPPWTKNVFLLKNVCLNLRMHSVRVADRLADPQGQQGLVAGVG